MEIQKISRADILDIIFEGRNKDYGAYDLRKTYNRRLTRALAMTGSVCLLLIGGYTWAGKMHPSGVRPLEVTPDINLVDAQREKPVTPPPPVIKTPPPQMAMIKDVTARIVPDDQVKPEDVPPPNADVDNMKIGTVNQKGDAFDRTVDGPPNTGGTTGVIEQPKRNEEEDNSIHLIVEIESAYPGGMQAWTRFLLKNFRPPEEISGTVMVKFIVDKEGNVSDVEAIDGPDELRAEAVRVIKKSGKWTPAIQNGRKVNSYKRQPIIVKLQD